MNYLEKLSECYPESQAYIVGNNDPNIYSNLIWLTSQIPQATLDSEVSNVQSNDIVSGQNIFQANFSYIGNIYNKWIGTETSIPSNESPYIIPWKCKIIGISYSNKEFNSNIDLQIFKSDNNNENINNLMLQWDIRTSRSGYKTDIPSSIMCNPGDKIGIFLKKYNNDKPKNVNIVIYFQIDTTTTLSQSTESYSGNM